MAEKAKSRCYVPVSKKKKKCVGGSANLWEHWLYISASILGKYDILCSPSLPPASLCLLCKEEKFLIH